ncbi:MAG: type II toxin-antitoxin system VapC family toxin [Alphaproteobacteria bacterium]|nr:type II toxin-antitoxin system VapC family toxin [Alphaproteobacteria bacterium]
MTLVVDAAVAVKWFVREAGHDAAFALLDGTEALHAPDLILAEAAEAVRRKRRRGEITVDQVDAVAIALPHYFARLWPARELAQRAAALARALDRPAYDGFYLACAEAAGGRLATFDQPLAAAAGRAGLADLLRPLDAAPAIADRPAIDPGPGNAYRLAPLEIPLSKLAHLIAIARVWEQEPGPPGDLGAPGAARLMRYLDALPPAERVDALAVALLGGGAKSWAAARDAAEAGAEDYPALLTAIAEPLSATLMRGLDILRRDAAERGPD